MPKVAKPKTPKPRPLSGPQIVANMRSIEQILADLARSKRHTFRRRPVTCENRM